MERHLQRIDQPRSKIDSITWKERMERRVQGSIKRHNILRTFNSYNLIRNPTKHHVCAFCLHFDWLRQRLWKTNKIPSQKFQESCAAVLFRRWWRLMFKVERNHDANVWSTLVVRFKIERSKARIRFSTEEDHRWQKSSKLPISWYILHEWQSDHTERVLEADTHGL